MSPKDFRKLIVKNTKVVESLMCQKEWYDINYNQVPSVAMARYNNAFARHDNTRFGVWKSALAKGVDSEGNVVKVNAAALFPHDIIRTLKAEIGNRHGTTFTDSELANAQFKALPNYMDNNKLRIMPLCDFSGSMSDHVSGDVAAIDVSLGLGLYCSDRVGENNPFYRKFIPFSDDSRLVDWRNETFSIAAQKHNDGWCGSTNIRSALDQILNAAKLLSASNDQIPNCLLILSDMQFDEGTNGDTTSVEAGLREWEQAGYTRPRIVYWNLAGYRNSPAQVDDPNVGLVSGFDPSILQSILGGDDFSPLAIMERAIEKYNVVTPA